MPILRKKTLIGVVGLVVVGSAIFFVARSPAPLAGDVPFLRGIQAKRSHKYDHRMRYAFEKYELKFPYKTVVELANKDLGWRSSKVFSRGLGHRQVTTFFLNDLSGSRNLTAEVSRLNQDHTRVDIYEAAPFTLADYVAAWFDRQILGR